LLIFDLFYGFLLLLRRHLLQHLLSENSFFRKNTFIRRANGWSLSNISAKNCGSKSIFAFCILYAKVIHFEISFCVSFINLNDRELFASSYKNNSATDSSDVWNFSMNYTGFIYIHTYVCISCLLLHMME